MVVASESGISSGEVTPGTILDVVVGNTTVVASNLVDGTHPYFLNSSDSPGMNLINVSFDGTSYGNWRRGVLISLSAKNKLEFINGSCQKPVKNSPLFAQWRRCNDMVIAWLLNSLSKNIAKSIIYSQTAGELWAELEQRYGQADGAKLFQLQRELNNILQGTNDVAAYFTKLKRIWDILKVLNTFMACGCECNCGAKTHNHKMNEDQKLIQFLMGLNEGYSGVRGNILMMNPLPSTAQAYSIILHEESQREVHSGPHVSVEPSAFNVNAQKPNSEYRGENYNSNTEARKNNFCSYCKKQGHQKEKCYKLVGYPPSFKFTKPKRNFGNIQANTAVIEEGETSGGGAVITRGVAPSLMIPQGFTNE
ncbi:uncharacterized protein [Nicotiana tomentosiformis]|uniref:uncharacterized protein n=1 Tax=Nicotiana tomentosiformis TaxID=4098 RepID=UPI00388C777B